MLKLDDLTKLLDRVQYKDYHWLAREVAPFRFLVSARFEAEDADKPGITRAWYTRAYYIHADASPEEVFGTLLLLVLTSVEHEARERFLIDGQKMYGPHSR